jgi:hypothetical protein
MPPLDVPEKSVMSHFLVDAAPPRHFIAYLDN